MAIFRREKGLPEPEEEPRKDGKDGKSTVDVTITDETAHSRDEQKADEGRTDGVPEVTLPEAPMVPGAEDKQSEEQQDADSQGGSRPWPSQHPSTESTGRFSGGSL